MEFYFHITDNDPLAFHYETRDGRQMPQRPLTEGFNGFNLPEGGRFGFSLLHEPTKIHWFPWEAFRTDPGLATRFIWNDVAPTIDGTVEVRAWEVGSDWLWLLNGTTWQRWQNWNPHQRVG